MALTNDETQEYIRTVLNISDTDDLKVILKKQGGKSPAKPYVDFQYLGNAGIGAAPLITHTESSTKLEENISTTRTPILEIQFYTQTEHQALTDDISDYESANDICQRFEDNLKSDRAKRLMRETGFSILNTNVIFDLDKFLGDRWERRALIELTMNHATVATNEVEFFVPPVTVTITAEDI